MNGRGPSHYRVGYGEDAHRLEPGPRLVLGGVDVPGAPRGPVAHSDGDALLHAVADAVLSAFALGDIGQHFPPGAAATSGKDSRDILRRALELVHARVPHAVVVNCAAVVTLDEPKLGDHRAAITASCARLLRMDPERFGLTFKTSEGLATDHVQARATVLFSLGD
ncbi:MAG TPA: 2-C-methyl-D-erythritol 2,4-cyclodiphosphate synthase [Trueperaceae bacterium]